MEVINTDAEGRPILGDGLGMRQLGATTWWTPTLTGAIVVASAISQRAIRCAEPLLNTFSASPTARDRSWPLPIQRVSRPAQK